MRDKAIPSKVRRLERVDQLPESTLANRLVTHWLVTIMSIAEGRRFRQKINTLAVGSPIHFLRILSYGLANLRTMNATNYRLRDIADLAAGRQELPCSE